MVSEHGEEAAIAAVNRIRSGGVAGFFCREEFEVIVEPDGDAEDPIGSDAAGLTDDETIADDAGRSDDETIADVIGRSADDRPPTRLADVGPAIDDDGPDPAETANPTGTTATTEIDDEPLTGTDVEPAVFGGPIAPGADPARDRFLALLERRLDEASAAEDELLRRRARPAAGRATDRPSVPVASAPMAAATATRPAPMDTDHPLDRPITATPSDGAGHRRPRPVFWQRLDRVTDELASFLPASSGRTAVVGPLPLVSAVVTRLQSTPELASADVVVLTDRAGIVSEPTWRLERNGDRLIRAVEESEGRPVIVIIDVPGDLPAWVGTLQRRLRSAGVGLFRYALSGQPTSAELERYRQGADVPYAIDLTSRVEPGLVVGLIADRHPIVSVAGAELGPELLLALRRHVGVIEPVVEPMIDG